VHPGARCEAIVEIPLHPKSCLHRDIAGVQRFPPTSSFEPGGNAAEEFYHPSLAVLRGVG
jgi:hypothetical protein